MYTKITLFIIILFINGCVENSNTNNNIDLQNINTELFEKNIVDFSITPISINSGVETFEVSVNISEEYPMDKLPDKISICNSNGEVLTLKSTKENGIQYSTILSNDKVKKAYHDLELSKKKGPKIGCSFSVTKPGEFDENCDETCSETSLLGGETIFCVCFYDCSFEIEFW